MYIEELKSVIKTCDEVKEILEKILIEDDFYMCKNYFSIASAHTNDIKNFIYKNFMFFDSIYSIDGLVDDFHVFRNEKSIENIKGISRPCLSQLSSVKDNLIKSELEYIRLNNIANINS